MPDIDEDKYVVFKQKELQDWIATGEVDLRGYPMPLGDAVVIRLQDAFASTALFTYCNTIMSFLELMKDHLMEEDQDRLLSIADFFHQQACESQRMKTKLPD